MTISQLDTISRVILIALAAGMLAATVLGILVAAFARIVRTSATTRHVLWWIAFSAAAIVPVASMATSFQRIEHHRAPPAIRDAMRVAVDAPTASHIVLRVAPSRAAGVDMPNTRQPQAQPWTAVAVSIVRAVARVPGLPTALVVIWIAVAAVRVGLLVPGLLWLMRVKRAALPLDEGIVRRLRRYRYGTRTGRATSILLSADIDVPIAVGFGSPAILLPIRLAETEAIADIDHIVMHEHAHLNRYDDVTNLVQVAIERIFWYNPAIAVLGRRISLEREIACDDSVVAQTGRAHRYATCLWKLVESATLPARPVMAPGALLTPKQITRRIEQLLDSKRNALPRLSPTSAIVLGALGACLIVILAQRAPVIALEDPVAPVAAVAPAAPAPPVAPAVAAVPSIASKPAVAPVPAPSPVPIRTVRAVAKPAPLVRIESDATPEAIANAVVAAALARHVPNVAVLGTNMGLDIAQTISEKFAPASEWPQIERSIQRAKHDAARSLAMSDTNAHLVADRASDDRQQLPAFDRVVDDGSYDVIVRYAATTYVDFQGDATVASHTRLQVRHGTLEIDQDDDSNDERHHKPILVYAPSIDGVSMNGSADIDVEHVNGDSFALDIAGSGNFVAHGSTRKMSVTIDGSGDADLLGLAASTIDVDTEGSGNVNVKAPQTLAVHIDGSGDVNVHGTAHHVSSSINGSGSLNQI